MAAPDASASLLAWSWIIEACANSPSVDLSILYDLIGSVPNLSDNLGKEATEMFALRCLEALYDPDKCFKGDDSLPSDKKEFEFDSCESFQVVLHRVMEQTSVKSLGKGHSDQLANMRKGASNELVRGVRAFIEHRKPTLPKCALEQLRVRLQQKGGGSLATNMKQVNGSGVQNTNTDKGNKLLEGNSACKTPVCVKSRKELRHGGDDAIASTEQYLAPVDDVEMSEDASQRNTNTDKGSKLLEENSVCRTPVCVKRDRSSLQTEMHLGSIDVNDDNLPPRKELRHGGDGAIASSEQYLAPVDDVEMSEDASLQNTITDKGNKLLEENAACETPECVKGDRSSLQTEMHLGSIDGDDDNLPPRKELRHGGDDAIASTEQYLAPVDDIEMSEDASQRNAPHTEGEVPEGAHEVQMEGRESWIPSNANEEPVKPTCPRTCQMSDVCLVCKEGGELLTCANSCQTVVHERCLGFPARFDTKGDFICPLCAHSHALAVYAETKKNMLLASEELSLFIRTNPVSGHPQGKDVDRSVELSSTQTTSKDEESVGPTIPSEAVPSKQKDASSVDRSSKDKQQEDHLAPINGDDAPTPSKESKGEDVTVKTRQHAKGQEKMQIEEFNDAGLRGSNPNQQLHGPSKNAGTMEGKSFKNKPSRNCSRPQAELKLADQMKDALSESLGDHGGTSEEEICKNTTSKHSLRHQLKQKTADLKDACSASHNDSDGSSGDENCRAASKYSLRNAGKKISFCKVIPTTALERRVRLNWTAEEVDMLKEGVKRFAPPDMKAIPWKDILDFGSSVFLKGRTTVDLKDKWRGLVRSAQTQSK